MDENIEIFDPWKVKEKYNLNEGKLKIFGPYSKTHDKRFILDFYYEKLNDYYYLYSLNRTNSYNNLSIKFYQNKNVEISNISNSDFYTGSEYMLLALQILYFYGFKKCYLYDLSTITCKREINYFSNLNTVNNGESEINFRLISLLKNKQTFYMKFDFKPYIDNKCVYNEFIFLLEKLRSISWNTIDNYMENIKLLIEKKNNSNLENNFFNYRIYNKNRWKIFWNNVYKSWKKFYEIYYLDKKVSTPFLSYIYYNKTDCKYFINWLEIYNLSLHNYNSKIFNKRLNIDIGLIEFKKLIELSNKAIYILDNIIFQDQCIL
jgi:hypothetical protein